MRRVVGVTLIAASVASLFSMGPAMGGIYVRESGQTLYGWDAFSYFWGPAFLFIMALIVVGVVVTALIDWTMGD